MINNLKKLTITLFVIIGMLNVVMYFIQASILFIPDKNVSSSPHDWKTSNKRMEFADLTLKTEDNQNINAWFIPTSFGSPRKRKVVLFCHGNAGNMSHRRLSLQIFSLLGLDVLIFDYRGYGNSSGTPDEQGVYKDAKSAWNYLHKTKGYRTEDIIIFGRSLGGAVAMWLALEVAADNLILESTFVSFRGMAGNYMPYVNRLLVTRYNFDTESRVKKYKGNLLVVHSQQDDVIPYSHGLRIFKAANGRKDLLTINGGHNDGIYKSLNLYRKGLKEYLDKTK